ncbi:MAG: UbiA prenyltransferase [Candidatus Peregrinibacteria bacterium GW2011_GWE2_39_6]|nr:MAG: UbiA prenyltransferase [Candidatus Peregrinibacteria bacterium GW2011_GWF2_39_17]KKR26479.1 MAG: UbiA prenyltransferase [Candidatus Peregrinibacteria bacterium GW2011_GWE2_39_6]HCW32578.1 decaprenyl-phosphate phosphoribosyltransferase [Candidatus Peregrinibacteria bacterium]
MRELFQVLRLKQWIKNFLIFVPLIFSKNFFVPEKFILTIYGIAIFCLFASSAYVLNDLIDYKKDKHHPVKKSRPLASGALKIKNAVVLLILLITISLGLAYHLNPYFAASGISYLALNLAYSLFLKNIVIIDVMVLASFYVIRIVSGGVLIDVPLTPWFVIMTMLLALFLGFGKRRHELTQLGDNAGFHRISLKEYSTYFLDQMISVVTSSIIIVYIFYTLDETTKLHFNTSLFPLTIPFVIYGIFRYTYLIFQKEKGGCPTNTIWSDIPLLIDVALWVSAILYIIQ